VIDVLRAHPRRSALQKGCRGSLSGADFRRRLGGKREVQALEEQLEFWFRLRVAGEQKFAPVRGRYFHIDHLHGGKFLKRTAGRQAGCEAFELSSEFGRRSASHIPG